MALNITGAGGIGTAGKLEGAPPAVNQLALQTLQQGRVPAGTPIGEIKKLQAFLGVKADGDFGSESMKALKARAAAGAVGDGLDAGKGKAGVGTAGAPSVTLPPGKKTPELTSKGHVAKVSDELDHASSDMHGEVGEANEAKLPAYKSAIAVHADGKATLAAMKDKSKQLWARIDKGDTSVSVQQALDFDKEVSRLEIKVSKLAGQLKAFNEAAKDQDFAGELSSIDTPDKKDAATPAFGAPKTGAEKSPTQAKQEANWYHQVMYDDANLLDGGIELYYSTHGPQIAAGKEKPDPSRLKTFEQDLAKAQVDLAKTQKAVADAKAKGISDAELAPVLQKMARLEASLARARAHLADLHSMQS